MSILKIDIESAEDELFRSELAPAWLHKVDNRVIEPHNPECEAVFHRAIRAEAFNVSTCDELTVCCRT